MNRTLHSLKTAAVNALWLCSCLPDVLRFWFWSFFPRARQRRIVRPGPSFESLPLTEYADYADWIERIKRGEDGSNVLLLEPTSGSASASKLIPYTAALRHEFQAAVNAWIGSMLLRDPLLLCGRHFWSISPTTPWPDGGESAVPIGFAADDEYLGRRQRRLAAQVLAVPPELSGIHDPATFSYVLLLCLVRTRDLRLISIWDPSYLLCLLARLPEHWNAILDAIANGGVPVELMLEEDLRERLDAALPPDPRRRAELDGVNPGNPDCMAIWPNLRLISCWDEAGRDDSLRALRARFPGVRIEGKGLTATEGIVTIPFGCKGRRVCAVTSHFLEFEESASGCVRRMWELEEGQEYSVVLTTGGGLYRYRLHDVVKVTGWYHRTPCLAFLGRDNLVSDVTGEKLHPRHVAEVLASVPENACTFSMLAPMRCEPGHVYGWFVQTHDGDSWLRDAAEKVEQGLCANYHYRHARSLGQLAPLRAFRIEGDAHGQYLARLQAMGQREGNIKRTCLSPLRDWERTFTGHFVPEETGSGT